MRRAMADAEVGDDDYGEDPTVRALEEAFAARVGKPAALFVPSGVMANQIAVRVLSRPGTAVVAGRRQHVVAYEYGAAAMNAGIQFIELDDTRRHARSAGDVRWARQAAAHHQPDGVAGGDREHAHGRLGGAVGARRAARARRGGRRRPDPHGRGAALQRRGRDGGPGGALGGGATTVMCCLSKGLCAPVGSLLAGPDGRDCRGATGPQAPGRGHAPGRCARRRRAWSPSARWSSACPRTMPGRPGWPTRWRSAGRARSTRGACARTSSRSATAKPDKLLAHLEGHGVLAHAIAPGTVRFVTHHDVDDAGIARAIDGLAGRARSWRMKVRIGISGGGESAGPEALVGLARAIGDTGFDSLWLPEVLTRPGPDPLVGLAWVAGACPGLKIGTTMLLPGAQSGLAGQGGGHPRPAVGRPLPPHLRARARPGRRALGHRHPDGGARAAQMEDALPVLRRLWAGEVVSHEGIAGSFADVSVSPRPVQDPFDVWLGGNVPSALERCGRLADGWIPAFCTPADAAAGKEVIDRVAAEHGRAISPEHFGVSLAYAPEGADLAPLASTPLARPCPRATARRDHPGRPVKGLRAMIERFFEVGFSKFIVRPLGPPEDWRAELEAWPEAVGDLQT